MKKKELFWNFYDLKTLITLTTYCLQIGHSPNCLPHLMHEHICPQSNKTQSIKDSMQILHRSDSSARLCSTNFGSEKLAPFCVYCWLVVAVSSCSLSFNSFSSCLFSWSDLYKRLTLSMSSFFSQHPLYSTKFEANISLICFMVRFSMSFSAFRSEREARRFKFTCGGGGGGVFGRGGCDAGDCGCSCVVDDEFSVFKVEYLWFWAAFEGLNEDDEDEADDDAEFSLVFGIFCDDAFWVKIKSIFFLINYFFSLL